jgi:lipoprotein-anchoring transpeptidase ErfK/SrfK
MRIVAACVVLFALTSIASAGIVARIDVSRQTMIVSENGRVVHAWPVSTARKGYRTPRGTFSVKRMHKMWHSRKYEMSPMPHSIFFYGGYAIHGTPYVKSLGRPASHGCVRLHPSHARTLYGLVKAHGPRNTKIILQN